MCEEIILFLKHIHIDSVYVCGHITSDNADFFPCWNQYVSMAVAIFEAKMYLNSYKKNRKERL